MRRGPLAFAAAKPHDLRFGRPVVRMLWSPGCWPRRRSTREQLTAPGASAYGLSRRRGHGRWPDDHRARRCQPSVPSSSGYIQSQIDVPWDFDIDPTGRSLLVANNGSGTVKVFRITDNNTEMLTLASSATVADSPRFVGILRR
jgi:hypothetical protein